MKIVLTIKTSPDGVVCNSYVDGHESLNLSKSEWNLYVIGAIEIARASLLAQRWGLNIGAFKNDGLVSNEDLLPDPTSEKP
jgi:hypothetical protein